jgi:hypothetical protein
MRVVIQRLSYCALGLLLCGQAARADQLNAVELWAQIVQPTVQFTSTGARPPASSEVLHAMVHLAVYDAVVAIEGGSKPYGHPIDAPPHADVRTAVATAAYTVARARVDQTSTNLAGLDAQYQSYMQLLGADPATDRGAKVGAMAAAQILSMRADDGFNNVVLYSCSSNPPPIGEFTPNGGCGTQPVDVKLSQVKPYTLKHPEAFRPEGPNALTSEDYAKDFAETRDYGRATGSLRTPEQIDTALFWSENTYAQWNRNMINLAASRGLSVRETARLFAMAHTSAADAIIVGFTAKYSFRAWRPRTAIPLADQDGNPATAADPTFTPFLTVNHPEYPSAHGFWSTALSHAVAAFFGTRNFQWTIDSAVPNLTKPTRTFDNLKDLREEIDNARVWSGLHWRHSMHDGDELGRRVSRYVLEHQFKETHW